MIARYFFLTLKIKRFRRIVKDARRKEGYTDARYIVDLEVELLVFCIECNF